VENARWGPVIKFGKKIIRMPRKADETKYTVEEAAQFTLDEVKKFIEAEIPGAFTKKVRKKAARPAHGSVPKKKPAGKKAPPKKKKD
jgi:DNA topoisomerase-1